jgi:hypothetical protein
MQGNCSSDTSTLNVSAPDLLSLKAGQCVLLTDGRLVEVEDNLSLDNLYIRQFRTSRGLSNELLGCFGEDCNLWLTSVTLQGAPVPDSSEFIYGGVNVAGGQLYAEGAKGVHSLFMNRMLETCFSLE